MSNYKGISADAIVFRFDQTLPPLILGISVVFFGFAILPTVLLLKEQGSLPAPTLVAATAFFGLLGTLSLRSFLRLRYSVAVNHEGLWYRSAQGASTFIAWSDVSSVIAQDTQQCLAIFGRASNRQIRLDYQLKDFGKLRDFVLDHTEAKAHLAKSTGDSFHRTWINKVILLCFTAAAVLIMRKCLHDGQQMPALVFGGIAVFLLAAVFLLDPTQVRIAEDAVLVRYLLRKRIIPFNTINAIVLKDIHDTNGNVWAAVIIERHGGRPIKLFRFREGSVAMQKALERAWHSASHLSSTSLT